MKAKKMILTSPMNYNSNYECESDHPQHTIPHACNNDRLPPPPKPLQLRDFQQLHQTQQAEQLRETKHTEKR